jgi:hypothetical protein
VFPVAIPPPKLSIQQLLMAHVSPRHLRRQRLLIAAVLGGGALLFAGALWFLLRPPAPDDPGFDDWHAAGESQPTARPLVAQGDDPHPLAYAFQPLDLAGKSQAEAIRLIVRRHDEALAGRAGTKSINTIRVDGTISMPDEDEPLPFVLTKKVPNKVRLILFRRGVEIHLGFDGKTAWRLARRGESVIQSEIVEASTMTSLIRHASLTNELIDAESRKWPVQYGGDSVIDGVPYHQLSVQVSALETVEFFIDQRSYLDTRRVITRKTDSGTSTQVVTYQDFRATDSFVFPWLVTTSEHGAMLQQLAISDVKVNPGVLNHIFEPPTPAP